jgi:foldase protein PrsA
MIALRIPLRVAMPLVVLGGIAALASGCGGGGGGSVSSGAVAVVNGQEVTQAQFDELMGQVEAKLKEQKQKVPAAGSTEFQGLQQSVLRYLIQKVEYQQKADELGVKVTDKQVQERLDSMIKQFYGGSEKRYVADLKKQGFTDAQWRDQIRTSLIAEGLAAKVASSVKVTKPEIQAYYQANLAEYTTQPSRQVRHILVPSKQLANEIYGKLQAGGNFAALAKKYSTDPGSKNVGGKLTIVKGQTVPAFDAMAFKLKVNEISKPVKTQFGYHVIQALTPITKTKTKPLSELEPTIRETLLNQKKSEAFTTWLENLNKEYASKITYAKGYEPPPVDTTTTPTG